MSIDYSDENCPYPSAETVHKFYRYKNGDHTAWWLTDSQKEADDAIERAANGWQSIRVFGQEQMLVGGRIDPDRVDDGYLDTLPFAGQPNLL